MPKTIVKIKTWVCPNCGYKQDFEPTDDLMLKHFGRIGALCSSCGKSDLIKEINPDKKIALTVMGEEDIETEIIEKEKEEKMAEVEKTQYRDKRKQDIEEAIKKAKELEDK